MSVIVEAVSRLTAGITNDMSKSITMANEPGNKCMLLGRMLREGVNWL